MRRSRWTCDQGVMRLGVKFGILALGVAALAAWSLAGCRFHSREITSLDRKEAASLASEGRFAATLKEWPRAEGLFAQAAEKCPDTGEYWVSLGIARVSLGKRSEAKDAYVSAVSAYEDAAKAAPASTQPILQKIYVLALLGRVDEARLVLEKERGRLPEDRDLRMFAESRELDRLLADPGFRQIALH